MIVKKILSGYSVGENEMMLDTVIAFRQDHRKSIPFANIKSRNAAAILLSYYGNPREVYELMRIASHKTRAYIVNAGGLKGYLVNYSFLTILQKA